MNLVELILAAYLAGYGGALLALTIRAMERFPEPEPGETYDAYRAKILSIYRRMMLRSMAWPLLLFRHD